MSIEPIAGARSIAGAIKCRVRRLKAAIVQPPPKSITFGLLVQKTARE